MGKGSLSLLFLLLLSACGKEAPPLPPFIRIPEAVKDLRAVQSGNAVILSWTNPAKNIDGSAATNLAQVEIRTDGGPAEMLSVTGAGQPQSHSIPIRSISDKRLTYTIVTDTAQGKKSAISNTAAITPVEVPGKVSGVHAVVDQRLIMLRWDKPAEHPELADAYVVIRTDMPESQTVSDTQYDDSEYEPGKIVTYQVTAIRRVSENAVLGVGPQTLTVTVEDKTPPRAPAGLDIVQSDTGAYLTWNPNTETDLAGYRIFRSENPNGVFRPVADRVISTNAFFDPSYRSGQSYRVSAIDEFGNESAMSDPLRGP
jgi:hypothetical protein